MPNSNLGFFYGEIGQINIYTFERREAARQLKPYSRRLLWESFLSMANPKDALQWGCTHGVRGTALVLLNKDTWGRPGDLRFGQTLPETLMDCACLENTMLRNISRGLGRKTHEGVTWPLLTASNSFFPSSLYVFLHHQSPQLSHRSPQLSFSGLILLCFPNTSPFIPLTEGAWWNALEVWPLVKSHHDSGLLQGRRLGDEYAGKHLAEVY